MIEALSLRGEDAEDRNIPALLWHGMAQRMPQDLGRAMGIARKTRIPQLADWAYWYAATLPGPGLQDFLDALSDARGDVLKRRLAGLVLALDSRANLDSPPASWAGVAARLYAETDVSLRRQAEMLGAAMGDRERFPELRRALADGRAPKSDRLHAFRVLSRALDPESLPTFLRLLDEADFRSPVLPVLGRYKDDRVATALIQGFERWGASEQQAALGTLSSRASFGVQLLDAIPAGKIQRDRVSAFYVRQLAALQNPDVDSRLKKLWGRLTQTSSEKLSKINQVSKMFDEAPLWAFDGQAGHAHFTKLCAPCHRLGEEGARIGPELTGAGRHGTRYLVENIIDPNAVIGADFQVTSIETKQGEVVSGLVVSRSADSVTLRTTVEPVVVAKSEIARETISENSLMPEGLLDGLSDREKVELLKFLREH
ncbi:MAG: c-type cytochrome [Verrucomicrobia bacterium]|nr:c-type cytochrome [Verrucomicrobiota bacterium]